MSRGAIVKFRQWALVAASAVLIIPAYSITAHSAPTSIGPQAITLSSPIESCWLPPDDPFWTGGGRGCGEVLKSVVLTPLDDAVQVSWTPGPARTVSAFPFVQYQVYSTTDASTGTSGTCTSDPGADSCTVQGLINGAPYRFTIVATDSISERWGTQPLGPVVPCCGVPDPVGEVLVDVGSGFADVSWSAPEDWGGSSELEYTATSSLGTECTSAGLTCRLENVDGGQEFTVSVSARNSAGASPALSSAPVSVPATTPSAVTGGQVKYLGATRARVSWDAPLQTGGRPITEYVVTAKPGGATCTTTRVQRCVIDQLQPGQRYSFTIKARNALGTGPASEPIVAGKITSPRSKPRKPTAALQGSAAVVSWAKPPGIKKSDIIAYRVQGNRLAAECTTRKTRCTIANLQPGTDYNFTIRAITTSGLGAPTQTQNITRPLPTAPPPPPKPEREFS